MQPIHTQAEGSIEFERGRFKRCALAFSDLDEARNALNRLLGRNGKVAPTPQETDIRDALLVCVVIGYGRICRPSRKSAGVPGHLPERFANALSPDLQQLHHRLLKLRDQEFAHSDAAVADIKVDTLKMRDVLLLVPLTRVLRVQSLDADDLRLAVELMAAVHVYLYDEMERLRSVLTQYGEF